jgi:two-component system CheB/CheR fusion protein
MGDADFENLLDYLRSARGFDFSGYKRPTLVRRVQKRVDDLQLSGFGEYRDHLEVHADEFDVLFNTILINVTAFFRDPKAWEYLDHDVVPRILDSAPAGAPIRIWSAGCASGEEAYTLAMVFAERLGEAAFRARVKIYATDVDEEALAHARTGAYDLKALAEVPEPFRDRYFTGTGNERSFRADLRRAVIFGRHDLTRDAPISRLDLVTCRNTLMYFNAETQGGIVRRLHYALNPGAYLFLGRAEMLLSYGDLFKSANTPFRIFTKIPRPPVAHVAATSTADAFGTDEREREGLLLHELAQNAMRVPQLIVDAKGNVAAINDAASRAFSLLPSDVGRPFQDLEVSYRPIDLRTPIDQASTERRAIDLHAVERRQPGTSSEFFEIQVVPLGPPDGPFLGAAITFTDVTRLKQLQIELKRTTEELETAYEELQSANEELETTNEELQSTVEELETTNEELQSTNEELETTNEELRSTNEELDTMNEMLQRRTDEVSDANAYLNSIVDGVSVAVVVVDDRRIVRTWNLMAEEMWGLRAEEVLGRSLYDMDSGLPVEQLRQRIDAGLADPEPLDDLILDAVNRRGRPVRCRIKLTRLHTATKPGMVMLIEENSRPR